LDFDFLLSAARTLLLAFFFLLFFVLAIDASLIEAIGPR
jgi:hypothetical protein